MQAACIIQNVGTITLSMILNSQTDWRRWNSGRTLGSSVYPTGYFMGSALRNCLNWYHYRDFITVPLDIVTKFIHITWKRSGIVRCAAGYLFYHVPTCRLWNELPATVFSERLTCPIKRGIMRVL